MRSSSRAIRTSRLREVERVLVPEGRVDHRRLQSGEPVGPAPASGSGAPTALARRRASSSCRTPASSSAIGACATGCACSASRSRPAASAATFRRSIGQLAGALRLDGACRRPLVAGVRRALLHRRRQARARHAAGRPGPRRRARRRRTAPAPAAPRRSASHASRSRRWTAARSAMKWTAYTDGACAPTNPGPAGWGAVVIAPDGGGETDHFGFIGLGTNQIAELTAAIEGPRRAFRRRRGRARLRQPVRPQGPDRVARRLGAQGLPQLEGRAGRQPRALEAALRRRPTRGASACAGSAATTATAATRRPTRSPTRRWR